MELEGRQAPPMANGELVFDAPWQGRVFGMARALCESGLYDWDEFRACLIHEIESWDSAHDVADDYPYYDLFLSALASLLAQKGICLADDLAARSREYAARPHGHDHRAPERA
jgi:nitrile hydratase accessory protein